MFEKACVHTYSQGGQNLVVDGNSGAVHVLDTEAMSLIREACARDDIQNLEDLDEFLKSKAHSSDIVEEISALVECGLLFSPDLTEAPPRPETIVKALCLNVAHDCNLRCDYCFASTGDFKGARELMSLDVAKAAVDFLLQNSKHRKQLEIDFFGGEPLMNWDVVRQTVEYAEVEAAKLDKTFRFTITTNGLGLTPAIEEFINEHMYNVVLSIDGRKEVNDRVRRTVSNKGSVYEVIIPKFQRL
ncbi:MAG: 4Fe-4S cluster-binding domain-containing protein, partial [Limnochordia bacterium]|nr:4Fe-4S cluster-binding domain-containing protein [Limnochordia bacterium]